ncbi:hypothetical protein GGQ24_09425 [Nocardioides sp. zg-578]|nr:hypothetical protein [Nocardioides marmotae]
MSTSITSRDVGTSSRRSASGTAGSWGRPPDGAHRWRPGVGGEMAATRWRAAGQVLVVLLLVGAPLPLALWLLPDSRDLEDTALAHELLVYPSVLVAGTLFYVSWRVHQTATVGWLAAAVTLVGAQGLGSAAVRVSRPAGVAEHASWHLAIDIALYLGLILVTALAARRALPVDPLAAGLLTGLGLTALRVGVLRLPGGDSRDTELALSAVLFVIALLLAAMVLRMASTPAWVRVRVATAVTVLAVSHVLTPPAPVHFAGIDLVAVALTVTGGVLLATTGFDLLRENLDRQRGAVRGLREQVEHLEAGVRVDRARLHEIHATLAGIAHASRLLHDGVLPAQARRGELERMIDLEMSRLQRLMGGRERREVQEVALDELLSPLVVVHRARGRVIHWEPSGQRACCRPDDLTTVVNILLENVAQHAASDAHLEVRRSGDRVEVRVRDRGPGIEQGMEARLFHWGDRGVASRGQGIGLSVASRLMAEQDGRICVEQDGPTGTTFVVTVPAAGNASGVGFAEGADDRAIP